MTVGPSHLYTRTGREKNVPDSVIRAALETAQFTQRYGLPAVLTLRHLAHLTGADYGFLRKVVSRSAEQPYRVFAIRKRDGGKRFICVPTLQLGTTQSWLQQYVLSKLRPHWRSFAYAPGSSVVACAAEHCGNTWLIKVDIERFFESVTERAVYSVFRTFGYLPLVSLELARICTRVIPGGPPRYQLKLEDRQTYSVIPPYRSKFLGTLPQGAPSSPMLANLACWTLDEALHKAAQAEGLVYTRYADDLTFSTAESTFDRKRAGKFVHKVYRLLDQHQFAPKTTKTKVIPPGAKKIVLGLLVDRERPRLTKEFRHRLEHHARGIQKFGLAAHAAHHNFDSTWGFRRHIEGLIAFAAMVDDEFARVMREAFSFGEG